MKTIKEICEFLENKELYLDDWSGILEYLIIKGFNMDDIHNGINLDINRPDVICTYKQFVDWFENSHKDNN